MKKSIYILFLGFIALFAFSCNNPFGISENQGSSTGNLKISIGKDVSARMIGSEFSDISDVESWTIGIKNIETEKTENYTVPAGNSVYSFTLLEGLYDVSVKSASGLRKFEGLVEEIEVVSIEENPDGVSIVVPVGRVNNGTGTIKLKYDFNGEKRFYDDEFSVILKNLDSNEEIEISKDAVTADRTAISIEKSGIPSGFYKIIITSVNNGPLVLSESYIQIADNDVSLYENGWLRQFINKKYYATVKESEMNGISPAAPINIDNLLLKLSDRDAWDSVVIYLDGLTKENFDVTRLKEIDSSRNEINKTVTLYSDYYGNKLYAKYENGDFSYSEDVSVFENAYDVVYVSQLGNDSAKYSGGISKNFPLANIELAVNQVAPGGKIVLLSDVVVNEGIVVTKDFTITVPDDCTVDVKITCYKDKISEKTDAKCIFVSDAVLSIIGNETGRIIYVGDNTDMETSFIKCEGSIDNEEERIATLNMKNVVINKCSGSAIEVHNANLELNNVLIGDTEFVPQKNSLPEDFQCRANYGSAISAYNDSYITLNNTTIAGNWSETGTVYLNGDSISFTMNDSSIIRNCALNDGCGIHTEPGHEYEIHIYDSEIYDNTSRGLGAVMNIPSGVKINIGGYVRLGSLNSDRLAIGSESSIPDSCIIIDREMNLASRIYGVIDNPLDRQAAVVKVSDDLPYSLSEYFNLFNIRNSMNQEEVYLSAEDGKLYDSDEMNGDLLGNLYAINDEGSNISKVRIYDFGNMESILLAGIDAKPESKTYKLEMKGIVAEADGKLATVLPENAIVELQALFTNQTLIDNGITIELNLSKINEFSLEAGMFADCQVLKGIEFSNEIIVGIPENCFSGCTNLTYVYGEIDSLGKRAFKDCAKLEYTVPASIERLEMVFDGCDQWKIHLSNDVEFNRWYVYAEDVETEVPADAKRTYNYVNSMWNYIESDGYLVGPYIWQSGNQ